MLDIPNKIITIVLVFVMLVIAPLTWAYVRADMVSERIILNEMSQFIDRTTDKALISQQDIDDLYLAVNATGGTYDVKIKRYTRLSTKDEYGEPRTLYLSTDYLDEHGNALPLNMGDVIKVTVNEIGLSPSKRLLWTILRMDSRTVDLSLAGSVR